MAKLLSRIKRTNKVSKMDAISPKGGANDASTMALDSSLNIKSMSIKHSKLLESMANKWSTLSSRDQLALSFLFIFTILLLGVYGGYTLHNKAIEKQEEYQTAVSDYFWLRAQSSNIDPSKSAEDTLPIDQHLSQILTQSGVANPQVLMVQHDAQIGFMQDNQGVISNIISSIVNSGYKITNLNMQQNPDTKVIEVQATVSK